MKGTERMRAGDRGAALLLAVVMLAVMSLGAGVAWQRLAFSTDRQFRAESNERAWHSAEAGLETAVAQIRAQGGGYGGQENTPFDRGSFSVRVESGKRGTYTLEAVGRVHDERVVFAERRLKATLEMSEEGRVLRYRVLEEKP